MKTPILSVPIVVLACAIASTSFARNADQKDQPGFDSDLKKQTDEVRNMAHRLQGELHFPGSNRLFSKEVFEIDRDVFRFNSNVSSRRYTREQILSEVERIRGEFLNLERELKERGYPMLRVGP